MIFDGTSGAFTGYSTHAERLKLGTMEMEQRKNSGYSGLYYDAETGESVAERIERLEKEKKEGKNERN